MATDKITKIEAIEVFDSRGNPTIETSVYLESGISGTALVPSGASTGKDEALELRDRDLGRLSGKGVKKAVANVNDIIANRLVGIDVRNQRDIDYLLIDLDGTRDKSNLGANAILSVSLACARAGASQLKIPLYSYIGGTNAHVLPVPFMNVINGGRHANNNLDIQEFMIVPVGASSFAQALEWGVSTYHVLKELLSKDNYSTAVGDEGGFAPNFKGHEEALGYLTNAIEKAGYEPGSDIAIALDVAASEFYDGENYVFQEDGATRSSAETIDLLNSLITKFPIVSIEDPVAEDDKGGWELFTKKAGDKIQVVGDDLFVTNPLKLAQGIRDGLGNSILIKLNQIGTLTETLETIELAKSASYSLIISHRSGETEDSFIADLSVATNAAMIKTGAPARSERVSKYNRLLRIEKALGPSARYLGINAIKGNLAGQYLGSQ